MTTPMSRGSTWKRPAPAPRRSRDEQCVYLRASDRIDADGHADLDRARHDGFDLHLHDDECSDRIGGAETVYRDRQFRDHGDPVLHSCRKFSHPRRRRAPHDQFCDLDGRALVWRPRAGGRDGVRAVRRGVGIVTCDRDRDRVDHAAGDGAPGIPQALRRRRDYHVRRTRHPDPAVDRDGDLLRGDGRQRRARSFRPPRLVSLGRTDVHGRRHSRYHARHAAWAHDLYRAWKNDYPRLPRASWTERFVAFRKCMWGLLLILIVLGGIYAGLFTPTEAAAV